MGMTYKRGTVWWVKHYRNGRPMRESSHSSKESEAINLLKLREGDIAHGLPVKPKLNRIRFDEAADDLRTEYAVNGRRSADELERRIRLHLLPYFGGRRLAAIATADVNAFILKRQKDVMVIGEDDERQERKYSNGEINRELTTLKRILNLARQNGKLMHVPHVPMLKERNVRTGFFEREQIEHILGHLPPAIRPAVQFAYITGWRIPSEVLKLQWRHVDFEARVVRLDPHTTKNDEGRTFPFTEALERVLEAQSSERRARAAQSRRRDLSLGVQPFEPQGERQADHDVRQGVQGGVYEGGLSRSDSARPAADRRAEPGARRRSRARRHADDRAQDALGVRALQHRERVRPRRGREEAQRSAACCTSA
jgi:integrase